MAAIKNIKILRGIQAQTEWKCHRYLLHAGHKGQIQMFWMLINFSKALQKTLISN